MARCFEPSYVEPSSEINLPTAPTVSIGYFLSPAAVAVNADAMVESFNSCVFVDLHLHS